MKPRPTARSTSRCGCARYQGKANEALVIVLAKALGIARNRITLVSGDTQRKKILRIEADPEEIRKRLAELVGGTE